MKNNYGSKKKKRRAEFEARKFKREQERKRIENYNKVMRDKNSTLEEVAAVMGIPLR
jgi:hypothetical protein